MVLGLLNFLFPNVQYIELGTHLGSLILLPLWVFLIPETPRWLLRKGKVDKADKVLDKICKFNKRPYLGLDPKFKADWDSNEKGFILDLFRFKAVARNTICLYVAWFVFSFGYFGLMYHTPAFEWNQYLVFVFPAFPSLAFALVLPFIENKLGRKPLLTLPLVIAGTALMINLAFDGPDNVQWPVIVLSWSSTTLVSIAFGVGYVFTKVGNRLIIFCEFSLIFFQELYPTHLRTTALASASLMARLGAISAPLVAKLEDINSVLPLIIYGLFLLAGGIITVWIWPETRKSKHMETLEECNAQASGMNGWLHPFKQSTDL